MKTSIRAERIEIRTTAGLKIALEQAARLQDHSLSAFVLSASRDAAARELPSLKRRCASTRFLQQHALTRQANGSYITRPDQQAQTWPADPACKQTLPT